MSSKNQRLNATITIGSVLEGSVKRNVGFLKSGLNQVGNSIKEVERRQRELDRQRKVLRRQGQSVEHLDREYEQLEGTLKDLRRAQERWNRAAAASRRVGTNFKSMASDIGRNARRIAIGASLAGGAVFGLAKSTASLGDDVAKTADKLGFGVEGLQEYRYAAERSGVATSMFDSSMVALTKRVGEAAQGFGSGKKALDQLGLSAEAMVKLSPEEQLAAIADRMESIESPAERAAIAAGLFSRQGVGMVNMLRDGSKGLNQLREDARRTGYVLSEQAARDAEVFQDTLLDTQLTMKGLKNTVGAALLPVVTQGMRRIGDYLVENRADVERWAEGFADGVERVLPLVGDVVSGIGKIGSVVWSVTERTADMVGGWENFGMVIGAALASKTLLRIGKFAGSVFSLGRAMWVLVGAGPLVAGAIRAIGAAMAANPIGATVTAIALGATLIITNWEKIRPVVEPILQWLGDKFTWVWEHAGKPLVDGLKLGASGIGAAWEAAKNALDPILTWIGKKFQTVMGFIQPVIDSLKWAIDNGRAAVRAIGGETGNATPGAAEGPRPYLQQNALGGPFRPGWHLTGERGPELKFESRAGYVADNRAMRQLAGYAERVNALFDGSGAGGAKASASPAGAVTQNITYNINAAGASADEVIRLIERKSRQAAGNGLYDRVPATGPYGR